MWPLAVSELFFVGKATAEMLHRLGIHTIGELALADEEMIKAHLKIPGEIIQGYARGEDLQPYLFTHEANKGYGNSLTAPVDIVTKEYAQHVMLSLCETVGMRLRNDRVKKSVLQRAYQMPVQYTFYIPVLFRQQEPPQQEGPEGV